MPERELKRVDISEVTDFAALAEEVRRTKQGRVVQRANQDIVTVLPVQTNQAIPGPRGKPFTMDDPLWDLLGIGHSAGATDVSANKHKYIADAIYAESHPPNEA